MVNKAKVVGFKITIYKTTIIPVNELGFKLVKRLFNPRM